MTQPLSRKQLMEGGNAIKTSTRINQLNVAKTLETVYAELLPKLNIKKSDTAVLGSTGKKDPSKNGKPDGSSGDIDLGISAPALMKANNLKNKDEVFEFLEGIAKTCKGHLNLKSLDVMSVGWPIVNEDGLQEDKIVQLDLVIVEDLKFASWAYYSAAWDESKYKALYPKEVYYACARYCDTKVTERGELDGKEVPATWDRFFLDLAKGLMQGTQTIKGKTKLTKTAKTIEKKVVSTDPQAVVTKFFGPNYKPKDVLTWEQVWEIINSEDFILKDKLQDILKMVKKGIERKNYPIPPELETAIQD